MPSFPLMRDNSFKPLSSLLYGLRQLKFFLLGLLVDVVLVGGLFALFWIAMPIDCPPTCTVSEYLKAGWDILGMEVVLFIWLWHFSIPVLAAPPVAGLWADLSKLAAKD